MTRRRGAAVVFAVLLALAVAGARPAAADDEPGRPAPEAPAALVAVASNFATTATRLAEAHAARTGARVELSFGATGKHATQVLQGAPFDAFLAADAEHPALLEREGRAVAGTRFTYAVGRLVLWSRDPARVAPGAEALRAPGWRRLAIAKPEVAPYGAAAREVLEATGTWEAARDRLVFGQNIAQALQYAQSGHAEMAFVARAQVLALPPAERGGWWEVPAELHAPIVQDAILLRENATARGFLEFLASEEARGVIEAAGYEVPARAGQAAPPAPAAPGAPGAP